MAYVKKNNRPPRPGEGRPTKYLPEYIARVDDYLADCQDEYDEFHKNRSDNSNSYERLVRVNLPQIEQFAKYIGVNKTTLYEWAKEFPKFSNALDKISEEQRNRLLNNGLSGDYNPMIAKLILSANHGMREKSDVTTDGEKIESNTIVFQKFGK